MRALLFLLCAGCGAKFAPETLVADLRVLAITAQPPEVGPGEASSVSVLYANPQLKVPTSVLWVGCEPDPQDLGRSACNDASILLRPTIITDYPPGLQLLGFGPTTSYHSTPGVFDVLPSDSSIRQTGSVGQVIGIVIGETVNPAATGDELRGYFERIENKTTQAVVGLTRVLVSEKPVAERNHNPGLLSLVVNGQVPASGARLAFEPGAQVALGAAVSDDSRESYTEHVASGDVTRVETVVGAWYSTSGRFDQERFDVTSPTPTTFTVPGSTAFTDDPVPARRTGTLWLVVRDDRGGQAFASWPFFVCDDSLPAPVVNEIHVDSSNTVIASGANVDSVLDVLIGGVAISESGYSSARNAFVGTPPALGPGTYPVTVKSKGCASIDTGLMVTLTN